MALANMIGVSQVGTTIDAAANSLVLATFTAPDNTLIQNYTPEKGAQFQLRTPDSGPPVSGTVRILSNDLAFTAGAEGCITPTGVADVRVRAEYTPGAASRVGVMIRSASNGNCVVFRIRGPESLAELVTITGGTFTTVDSAAFTPVGGQTYTLTISAKGSDVSCEIDGTEVITSDVTSAHQTATDHGLCNFGSDLNERFNNLEIQGI